MVHQIYKAWCTYIKINLATNKQKHIQITISHRKNYKNNKTTILRTYQYLMKQPDHRSITASKDKTTSTYSTYNSTFLRNICLSIFVYCFSLAYLRGVWPVEETFNFCLLFLFEDITIEVAEVVPLSIFVYCFGIV